MVFISFKFKGLIRIRRKIIKIIKIIVYIYVPIQTIIYICMCI